jgi:serine protease Do
MDEINTAKQTTGRFRRPVRLTALALSSAAAVALLAGMSTGQTIPATTTPIVAPIAGGYADVVERVMPAVVSVSVKRKAVAANADTPEGFGPEGGPDSEMFQHFMERFFNGRGGQFRMPQMPQTPRGGMPMAAAGTGFIFHDHGHIATNYHVVADAGEVTVTLSDGREFPAEVVATDPETDLALLEIHPDEPLPYVEFGDSDKVRVGDPVIAIGNPFGLGSTVTTGVVSAEHRVIGAGRFDDFMQIDAAINHGNSGGPTFNLEGKVIGINTAIQSPTGGNVGIGFAIPSNLAWDVLDQLHTNGQVERGWLGVHIQGVDKDLAASLDLDDAKGALVAQVQPDSPAAAAGLHQGDVILSYNGEAIDTLRDLTSKVASTDPGTDSELTVWRNGEKMAIDVEIGTLPGQAQMASAEEPADANTPKLGVALAKLTDADRESLHLSQDVEGAIVTEVNPGSPAAEKGVQRGDVIVEVDRQKVSEPKMVADAVRQAAERGDESVLLLIKREGQDRFVALRLERA